MVTPWPRPGAHPAHHSQGLKRFRDPFRSTRTRSGTSSSCSRSAGTRRIAVAAKDQPRCLMRTRHLPRDLSQRQALRREPANHPPLLHRQPRPVIPAFLSRRPHSHRLTEALLAPLEPARRSAAPGGPDLTNGRIEAGELRRSATAAARVRGRRGRSARKGPRRTTTSAPRRANVTAMSINGRASRGDSHRRSTAPRSGRRDRHAAAGPWSSSPQAGASTASTVWSRNWPRSPGG